MARMEGNLAGPGCLAGKGRRAPGHGSLGAGRRGMNLRDYGQSFHNGVVNCHYGTIVVIGICGNS